MADPLHKPLQGQRILVTRPAHQAGGQAQQLEALGADAVVLPLLEIHAIGEDEPALYQQIKNKLLDLDLYSAVIFVSRNAARIGTQWIDTYWPQLPLGVHWMAIGAATAATLEAEGIPTYRAASGYDSEALLADPLLSDVAGQRILIMRGEGGRELLAETLRNRGAQVDYADLYRRRCPEHPAALIKSTIYAQALSGILITSGEALENLLRLAGTGPELLKTELVVPSQRLAALATARGFTRIRVADGPDDPSMIRALLPEKRSAD